LAQVADILSQMNDNRAMATRVQVGAEDLVSEARMSRKKSWLGVAIAVLALLSACSRSAPPPPPAAGPKAAPAPAAAIPTPAPHEQPAESSLALKRGVLSLASEQATFQPCGETAAYWVIDQTDGVLRQTFPGGSTPIELYVEAHGERTQIPANVTAARTYPGAFILEEVLYAVPPAESQGCKAAAPTYIVSAHGNEPFWAVEVSTDKMTWRQPEDPTQVVVESPQSQDSEGTVGYTGSGGGHTLELFVDAQPCRDSMSEAFFAYSARAVLDGKEFKGCARIGE
jgi:uncharacterized membrane protein